MELTKILDLRCLVKWATDYYWKSYCGVGICNMLVACTKVQRAIVVFLAKASVLPSHFKVQSNFFYVVGKTVRRTILYGDMSCSSFHK